MRRMIYLALFLILIGALALNQGVTAQEAPPVPPQRLGIGWAGMGVGFRYWTDGPWGLQAGGVVSNSGWKHGDNYQLRHYMSGGINTLYRLTQPGEAPITYLALNLGGEYSKEENQWCSEEEGCHGYVEQHTTVGAMALGGMEFFLFNRFGLSAEVGLRYSQTDGRPSLWPGFGVALLFYLF